MFTHVSTCAIARKGRGCSSVADVEAILVVTFVAIGGVASGLV